MIKFIMLLLVVNFAAAEEKKVCTKPEKITLGKDAEGKPVVVPLGVACATWDLPTEKK